MTDKVLSLLKFGIVLLIGVIFATQFLAAYKTKLRNDAIDGCAQSSSYQNQFTDAEGRLVTNREPQKAIYEKCLLLKNVR